MSISIPVVEVAVLGENGKFADFHVVFYGIPIAEFRRQDAVPMVAETFRRRGLEGCLSSPLVLRERHFEGSVVRRPKPKVEDEPYNPWTRGLNA